MQPQEKLREGINERPDARGTLLERSIDDYHSGSSVVNRKLTTVPRLWCMASRVRYPMASRFHCDTAVMVVEHQSVRRGGPVNLQIHPKDYNCL